MPNQKHAFRFSLVTLVLLGCLFVFAVKLILIQVYSSTFLADKAQKQHNYSFELEPVRGTIYDRNLRPLAFNVPVYSLYANPRVMSAEEKKEAIQKLAPLLGMAPDTIAQRLSREKYFVWLQRKLSAETTEAIKKLKIKGLGFRRESKRYYPNGNLAAHVIGFADTDNDGLEGLELFYNRYLRGRPGQMQVLRDAHQTQLQIGESYVPPQDGFHLVLTIDETIQYIAERALEKAYQKYDAKAAIIIVMDVKTGEILALANRPTYNLDDVAKSTVESRTNRAISYVYEPGSVFKVITTAAALAENIFTEEDKIFCENGKFRIANHILTDHTPHGTLTFRDVIGVSSNIGVVKIAQKVGPANIYKYAQRFRFGLPTGIDLLGEVNGWLKDPSQWSKTTIGAIPIGYEVTVTSLQLVCALAAIANEGVFMKPFVVKYVEDNNNQIIKAFEPQEVDRVIDATTARRVTEILKGVVENGTAKKAQIKGVKVAGKTGTARKVIDGRYVMGKYYASFMGFAPADNPRLAAIVILDQPHPSYFGGT
ncbi:MAG TPA: penicillin-binding transpeptidase domain-containing protein, partial [Candidatus Omnitrophota bacterium]|nr:penicillin-binding transpeptidase domain-containing protein [Candidatus Omnitrophota bacterium]